MITDDTLIYTNEGWKTCWELYVGQPVRSFDEKTNTCVDDTVLSIETDYIESGFMGIKSKSMNQLITQDHPIMIAHAATKDVLRKPIGEQFHHQLTNTKGVVHNRPYQYYKLTTAIEDIKWSARICASYAQELYFPSDQNAIAITKNLGGYESWVWLDTFFHWNVLRSNTIKLATCNMRNRIVRDIILELAPRAGHGARFVKGIHGINVGRPNESWTIQLDSAADIHPSRKYGWYLERYEGNVFNITTRNGSFLAKRRYGTFLIACNKE